MNTNSLILGQEGGPLIAYFHSAVSARLGVGTSVLHFKTWCW